MTVDHRLLSRWRAQSRERVHHLRLLLLRARSTAKLCCEIERRAIVARGARGALATGSGVLSLALRLPLLLRPLQQRYRCAGLLCALDA